MTEAKQAMSSGLDGVVVANTVMSDVDGERGKLTIRGYDVESLAGTASFEAVCWLLWRGALPSDAELASIRRQIGESRVRAFAQLDLVRGALSLASGMDALRASLSMLEPVDDETAWIDVTSATAVFAAAWSRIATGREPIAPDASLGHAADYVRMSSGETDDERASLVDAYLVTVSDHGMNASTFAARVVASTGSDIVSSIVAAVGALKGPLHGGAPGPVLDMLDAVGDASIARTWVSSELDAGRRIMGMGHRIYRVRDPRAAVLERALERFEKGGHSGDRLVLARAVEREAEAVLAERHPTRPLKANVEFYTAVLLEAAGIPRAAFSPTFAVGRVAGWIAHVTEQRANGRLIRPASVYVGPPVA